MVIQRRSSPTPRLILPHLIVLTYHTAPSASRHARRIARPPDTSPSSRASDQAWARRSDRHVRQTNIQIHEHEHDKIKPNIHLPNLVKSTLLSLMQITCNLLLTPSQCRGHLAAHNGYLLTWTIPSQRRSPRRCSYPSRGWHHTNLYTTADRLHADPHDGFAPPNLATTSHRCLHVAALHRHLLLRLLLRHRTAATCSCGVTPSNTSLSWTTSQRQPPALDHLAVDDALTSTITMASCRGRRRRGTVYLTITV